MCRADTIREIIANTPLSPADRLLVDRVLDDGSASPGDAIGVIALAAIRATEANAASAAGRMDKMEIKVSSNRLLLFAILAFTALGMFISAFIAARPSVTTIAGDGNRVENKNSANVSAEFHP